MDERTPYLGLPMPSDQNTLDEDLPRLRGCLETLDAQAEQVDTALAEEKAIRISEVAALGVAIGDERETRITAMGTAEASAREALAGAIALESHERIAGDAAEASARETALETHDSDVAAHNALVQRITVGSLSPIIGVCFVEAGGGSGLWFNVDADGQPISPAKSYFDYHPVYSGLKRVLIDGQIMVEVPQFWTKKVTPASGPFAGKPCRVLSPGQADGFKLFPAFMKNGQPLDRVYIGAYQGTNEGGSPVKAGSRPGKAPLVSLDFSTMKAYCANRNVNGVSGFMLWDVYQLAALQRLILTEFATPDAQAVIGRGHVDGTSAVATDYTNQPVWRGFAGLWGNVWQMVDGLDADTSRNIRLFKNDGSRIWVNTGFAVPAFDGTNVTYMVSLKDGKGDGYDFDDVFLPASTSTSSGAGSFSDGYWGPYGSAGNVAYHGGHWGHGSYSGLFTLYLSSPASYSGASIGCRLAKS